MSEVTTIDIILLGGVVTLIGKVIYDLISGSGKKPPFDHPSRATIDAMNISVNKVLGSVVEMDRRLLKIEDGLLQSLKLAERNAESYQQFILAVNDLSNINKNVLAETRAQTEILTKMLLNGKGK